MYNIKIIFAMLFFLISLASTIRPMRLSGFSNELDVVKIPNFPKEPDIIEYMSKVISSKLVNARDGVGYSPLVKILMYGREESSVIVAIKCLLGNDASIEQIDIDAIKACYDWQRKISILQSCGVNIKSIENIQKAENNVTRVQADVHNRLANGTINAHDESGCAVLMRIVFYGMIDLFNFLKNNNKVDIFVKSNKGRNLLAYAVSSPHENATIINSLIELGVDINERSLTNETPLLNAVINFIYSKTPSKPHISNFTTAIRAGASVLARDDTGRSAYNCLSENNHNVAQDEALYTLMASSKLAEERLRSVWIGEHALIKNDNTSVQ